MPLRRLALASLFACSLFGASPAYVKTVCIGTGYQAITTTCTGTVTNANDLIVVHAGSGNNAPAVTSVSDGTNSYTAATGAKCTGATDLHYEQWYGYAAGSGSRTFTATWASTPTVYGDIIVEEYSGAATSGVLDSGSASYLCTGGSVAGNGYTAGVYNAIYGNVTTTGANELVSCGMIVDNSGESLQVGTGFSNFAGYTGAWTIEGEDQAVSSAGTIAASMGKASWSNWEAGCVSYKSLVLPDYSVSGPSSGYVHVASTSFTITKAASDWASDPKTITISDGGNSGTVTLGTCTGSGGGTTPAALSLTGGTTCTFTYTPAVIGSLTLRSTINSGTDPVPNTYGYTSNPAQLSFSGCSSGNLRVASATCTVTITGGTFDGTHTVTLSDGGNLGTFTSGSSGNPLTVTPTASTSSFTYTYTPYLVGKKLISATTNQSDWQPPTSFLYTSSSTDACTFTAKANGNWASAATWTPSGCAGGGHTTPDTGDTVAITAYHVTVPSGTTAYAGSCPANNTTYDLTIAPTAATDAVSGILEVAGTLWLCGNVELNASAVANPAGLGVLQIDTGGSLKWDLNNGSTAYRLVPGVTGGWNQIAAGTLGDSCTFGTGSCPTTILPINLGTANPILADANGTTDSMTYRIYGTLVKNCGSASAGCVTLATDNATGRNSYANAGLVDIEGSIFDTTGTFQNAHYALGGSPNSIVFSLTFRENRFVNDLAGMFSLQDSSAYPFTKTCWFIDNYFTAAFGESNNVWSPCTFVGNAFAHAVAWYSSIAFQLARFQGNLSLTQFNDAGTLSPLAISGNYFAWTTAGSSTHNVALDGTAMNNTYTGNVHESLDSSQGEGHCTTGSGGSPSYTRTWLDNLSVMAPNGANSCSIGGGISASPGGGTDAVGYVEHNGAFGSGVYQWFAINGHDGGYYSTNRDVRSLRANLGYSPTSGAGNLMVAPNAPDSAVINGIPNTEVYVAQEGGNALYNAAASTDWGPGNGNSGCNSTESAAYGTPYDQCTASGTTAPGAGDIVADPMVMDHTRGLVKWASYLHGQAATFAGAQSALIACQNLGWCVSELVSWVRRGYQPTNLALKGKAYDGRIVGFTGTYGSGYTGTCSVTISAQDTDDLGYGAAATCSFVSGVPVIQVTNRGMHYRIATPAAVAIGGTCTGGCVAASLTPVISPHDIGPVEMALIAGVM